MERALTSRSSLKLILFLLVVALIAAVFALDMRRRSAEQTVQQLSVQIDQLTGRQQQQNKQEADRIVARVRKHFTIPASVTPTVARIVDVNQLRQRNAVYNKAKNGDFLVITTDRAVLYSPEQDVILDVIPVQVQPLPESSQAAKSQAAQVSSARK
jgi:hypothetical protein